MHADKNKRLLQVDFNTLGIKVSNKVILLLMGKIKHSYHTQSNKFSISLQYLKKEVNNGVHFLHADKHQSFYKLALLFLVEVVRHIQSTQIGRKLVIFLKCLKNKLSQLLLCFTVMQNILIFYRSLVMFAVTCFESIWLV